MPTVAIGHEAPWRAGLRSARANLLPGLALQVAALALVLLFYFHAPTHAALTRLAVWRTHLGLVFAIVSTGLFGGVLPVLFLRLRAATRHHYTWGQNAGLILFWSYKGFEVDLFYRFLAWLVGSGHDFQTIAAKAAIDQAFYSPVYAVPMTALFFEWMEFRFDPATLVADFRAGGWYRRRILPVFVSNVGVWLPAVCIIYSLPTPLQLPLQNLVVCFFTLLIARQVKRPV